MAIQIFAFALLAVGFVIIKYLNRTDIPKIKNLPEIPGVPLFGNLLTLGQSHARSCAQLVPKYGAVFQVRLGNRVSCVHQLARPLIHM